MTTANNNLNWSYNIYIEKCPVDNNETISLNGSQGYEQPFGESGISGKFSGETCYTIEFDLNFIKDTARLINGRLVIYNLPTSIYQKILYNGSGLIYKENGTIEAGAEILFLKLTLSYKGYKGSFNFKVNNCYTTGFPDRKTYFDLQGMGELDKVIQNNRSVIDTQMQTMPDESQTGTNGQSLLQTKLYWIKEYLKKYTKLELSAYIYARSDLYERVPYPNCDDMWGVLDKLVPNYQYYVNDNKLYLMNKNEVKNKLGIQAENLITEEDKQQMTANNNNYNAYFSSLPALVVNQYYDVFHNIPYWNSQMEMSISTPLRFDILPTRKVQLVCNLNTTKILSKQPTYLCSGVRHFGRFSQINGARGASELDLQAWNIQTTS